MVQADVRHGNGSIGVHVEGPNELSPEDAVVLNTLSYAYSGHRPIVSDISLSLPKGSRCLLLGANGAGEACLCKAASLSPQVLKLPKRQNSSAQRCGIPRRRFYTIQAQNGHTLLCKRVLEYCSASMVCMHR